MVIESDSNNDANSTRASIALDEEPTNVDEESTGEDEETISSNDASTDGEELPNDRAEDSTDGDEMESSDGAGGNAVSSTETLELTKYLYGLCIPTNFQNDAAVAKFAQRIFSSLHKELSDLARLKAIRDIEATDDINVIGPKLYNFPTQLNQSHKMLLYS